MDAPGFDPVWKALADPTRRRILDLLKDRPRTTGDLAAAFTLSRFAVMKHLGVLEAADLVVVRRDGRERWNHLNAVPLRRLYEHYIDPVSDHVARSLLALERRSARKDDTDMSPTIEAPTRMMAVEQQITIAAPASRVFRACTDELDSWWSARIYDEPTRLTLEARVGGRLYEEHDGDTVLWGIVRRLEPEKKIVFDGPFGLSTPVVGVTTFDFSDDGGRTTVRVSHRAFGEITDEQIAGYHEGWEQLMQRALPDWIERGSPRGETRPCGSAP